MYDSQICFLRTAMIAKCRGKVTPVRQNRSDVLIGNQVVASRSIKMGFSFTVVHRALPGRGVPSSAV